MEIGNKIKDIKKNNNNRFNNKKKKNFRGKKMVKEDIPEHIKSKVLDISNMTSPEAISGYLEERRKKFPTKKNIEIKDEERKLRIERGELIDIPQKAQGNKRKREDRNDNRARKRFKKICKYWRQGRCNSGENCRFLHDYVQSQPATEEVILRKILTKNIEYENQAILQCIHFIVSNNFLQKKPEPTQNNEEKPLEELNN